MKVAVVTGAGGLVGSEAVELLVGEGYQVFGIENDMRKTFFGPNGSTSPTMERLQDQFEQSQFERIDCDIRDHSLLDCFFYDLHQRDWLPELVIHTAAQPSHDWAAKDAQTDFAVNANGTLNLLQCVRKYCKDATFAHISTSKVYGDNPNRLPLVQPKDELRLDLPRDHEFYKGITTEMSVEGCLHSLFGVSKLSGDLLVQEFGRYFDMPTVCFRPGCVTGPAHAGVPLHGFLSYLMRCAVTGDEYEIIGYDGLQVRCNIHAHDLARACLAFHQAPKAGAVFNIGGGRQNSVSMAEAIQMCQDITGNQMTTCYTDQPRIGDHRWWISSNEAFEVAYPSWYQTHNVEGMLTEIYKANQDDWLL